MTELYRRDVLGAGAFRTAAFGVRHLLALAQGLKADALKTLGVEEQVFCSSRIDESETLVRQLLDAAFSHLHIIHSDGFDAAQLAIADWSASIG